MWNYNELFAEGNIVGVRKPNGEVYKILANAQKRFGYPLHGFCNDSLSFDAVDGKHTIVYIVCLDEHGRVSKTIFDRKRDVPSMPELKTGMFIRKCTKNYDYFSLGYVDAENNRIVYQDGGFNFIDGERGIDSWGNSKIIEVYGTNTRSFLGCVEPNLIWRDTEYKEYIDYQKSNK